MTGLQVRRFAAMLVVAFALGCSDSDDSGNPAGPSGSGVGDDPAITNTADNFQFQLTNASNFSTNGGYTWRNTGTTASVTNSSSISAGTATLTIRDSGGRVVYSRSLSESGGTTESGPSGDWRIELAPSGVSGTLNFRVQRGG